MKDKFPKPKYVLTCITPVPHPAPPSPSLSNPNETVGKKVFKSISPSKKSEHMSFPKKPQFEKIQMS